MDNNYRVFVSYSRDDLDLVEKIVEVLRSNHLVPMWDKQFAWGHGFPDQIKNFIAHAHVFMPIITAASSTRGWVHQEIGYAMALHIPVLPLTRDRVPGEMLHGLQAISLTRDLDQISSQLSIETFESLVRRAQKDSRALFEAAEFHEQRTMMMVEYATNVLELKQSGLLRQKGALSSLHIPNQPISHQIWAERFGGEEKKRSDFHCQLQLQERLALEKHARESGCRLIVDPYLTFELWGQSAKRVRLRCLIDTLKSLPQSKVEVAVNKGMAHGHNVTIVGDWFVAESVSGELGKGYRQTIFTRHGPTVRSRIEEFDHLFGSLLESGGIDAASSRDAAVAEIEQHLKELEDSEQRCETR